MQSENVKVAFRLRPCDRNPLLTYTNDIISMSGNKFYFDRVFNETSTQEQVYNDIAKPAINWCIDGYNSAIFAYGVTGSGKTFTMFGSKEQPGIVKRSCEDIFRIIETKELEEYSIKCSFLEIYIDSIRDLITGDEQKLKLREKDSDVFVQGLSELYFNKPEDIIQCIDKCMKNRATSSTALNNVSSRSHAVFTIYIYQKQLDELKLEENFI